MAGARWLSARREGRRDRPVLKGGREDMDMVVKLAVGFAFYVLAVVGGSPFVECVCGRCGLTPDRDGAAARISAYIGYFERFIATIMVLHGAYEGVAFLFVGKAVAGRFADRSHIEYYLVGSLASLSWAIGWGMVLRWLLGVLAA